MFCGFVDAANGGNIPFQVRDANNAPVQADALPTFRVYGPNGVVTNGTGTAAQMESGNVTGASNASPIVITSAGHGVSTGQPVTVSGVGGNTAANGSFLATAVDANTFSLQGTTGNGAYTSGGTWLTTGLYLVALTGAILAALQAGVTYTLEISFTLSAAKRVLQLTFTVR